MGQIDFKTIKEALSQPASKHFWIAFNNLTFDQSNNKVLANVGINGAIKNITFYRSSYRADFIPGIWIRKDFFRTGPYSFSVEVDGIEYDLSKVDWPFRTSLLDNLFPLIQLSGEKIKVTLITYAPISKDGKKRLRGIIYGIFIENVSDNEIFSILRYL